MTWRDLDSFFTKSCAKDAPEGTENFSKLSQKVRRVAKKNLRGGGGLHQRPPPPARARVKNYERYRHQTFSTLSDIKLTPCLKLLSNLVGKFLRKWRFTDVMSCDFELKMVVSYIDRRSMYAEANRKQRVSKQSKLNSLQDGYHGFSKCLDFDHQNFKITTFSEKKCSKIQFF